MKAALIALGIQMTLGSMAFANVVKVAEVDMSCEMILEKSNSLASNERVQIGKLETDLSITTKVTTDHYGRPVGFQVQQFKSSNKSFLKADNLIEAIAGETYYEAKVITVNYPGSCFSREKGCSSDLIKTGDLVSTKLPYKIYTEKDLSSRSSVAIYDDYAHVSWDLGSRMNVKYYFKFEENQILKMFKKSGEKNISYQSKLEGDPTFLLSVEGENVNEKSNMNAEVTKIADTISNKWSSKVFLIDGNRYAAFLSCKPKSMKSVEFRL